MNPIWQVTVVGAGAAGLMAAITAARQGCQVLLLEHGRKVGRKLLVSGNGRGNITNRNLGSDRYHGHFPNFVLPALKKFGFRDTFHFFEQLGIKLKTDENGRVYPYSQDASVIQKVLKYEVDHLNIKLDYGVRIQEIHPMGAFKEIKMNHAPSYFTKNMILATGGRAAPQLGATGAGYRWAEMLGHTLFPQMPALVQLKIPSRFIQSCLYSKLKAEMTIMINGKPCVSQLGDLFIIPQSVSGDAVFAVSRYASEALYQQKPVQLQIDTVPDYSRHQLKDYLYIIQKSRPHLLARLFLNGLLPQKIATYLLALSDIAENQSIGLLNREQIANLIQALKCLTLPVIGTQAWKFAQATIGGVSVKEVNPETMGSLLDPNLFFAGEILDVDGDCGGYNLQWAWSSGYLAGLSAAKKS